MPAETTPNLLNENELDEVTRRAVAFYDARLKSALEPEQNGQIVAVHLETGDYAVAENGPLARRALRERQPHGMIATILVGPGDGSPRVNRMLASQCGHAKRRPKRPYGLNAEKASAQCKPTNLTR